VTVLSCSFPPRPPWRRSATPGWSPGRDRRHGPFHARQPTRARADETPRDSRAELFLHAPRTAGGPVAFATLMPTRPCRRPRRGASKAVLVLSRVHDSPCGASGWPAAGRRFKPKLTSAPFGVRTRAGRIPQLFLTTLQPRRRDETKPRLYSVFCPPACIMPLPNPERRWFYCKPITLADHTCGPRWIFEPVLRTARLLLAMIATGGWPIASPVRNVARALPHGGGGGQAFWPPPRATSLCGSMIYD